MPPDGEHLDVFVGDEQRAMALAPSRAGVDTQGAQGPARRGGVLMVSLRMLGPGDAPVLECVAPGVFDNAIDARWTAEFLADPRHHMAVALDGGVVVGMASAVHYVHPDKGPELWVNEVGVAPSRQREGIGTMLLEALFARARALGCTEAWLGAEESNVAARGLYGSVGGEEAPMMYVTFGLRPRAD